jgi:hypothetical protein
VGVGVSVSASLDNSVEAHLVNDTAEESASCLETAGGSGLKTKTGDQTLDTALDVSRCSDVGTGVEECGDLGRGLSVELATDLLKTAEKGANASSGRDGNTSTNASANTGTSSNTGTDTRANTSSSTSINVDGSSESCGELGSSVARKRDSTIDTGRDTGSEKAAEESTKAELSLGVDGALDVAACRNHGVKTSRELDGSVAVDLSRDTSISRDLGIGVEGSANGGDTLDHGHDIGIGEVQTSLSLDLSLDSNTDAGTSLEPSLNTSADAGELGLKANNNDSSEVSVSLDADRGVGTSLGLALATERCGGSESTADHALSSTSRGSGLLAHQAAEGTSVARSTNIAAGHTAEAEVTTLNLGGGSSGGKGDESRESESVVNHVVEIGRFGGLVVVKRLRINRRLL